MRKILVASNRAICKAKVRYSTVEEAWEHAEIQLIQKGRMLTPYRCARSGSKGHYHLTHKFSLGDITNIPPEYRELYNSFREEPKPTWNIYKLLKKLRK